MKSKITLKELVGTKIIYAVLLVCYYWMWARRDWHSCYEVIQHSVAIFTIVFFALQAVRIHRYSKEEKDELDRRHWAEAHGGRHGGHRFRLRCRSRGRTRRGLRAGRRGAGMVSHTIHFILYYGQQRNLKWP